MPQALLLSRKSLLIILLLLSLSLSAQSPAQGQTSSPPQKTELHLSWELTPGINRYRLQVSRDAKFDDLLFDRAVEGNNYVLSDLPPGRYHWRIAPAASETGTFTTSRTIELKGEAKVESAATTTSSSGGTTIARPQSRSGWAAATGIVAHPFAFNLREQSGADVVGVNADGMVYALDASNGVALWTARFRPSAKRGEPTGNGGAQPFQPIALAAGNSLQNVLVAFDGGVRAIEGATGRELWRATLAGRASSAVVGDLNGDGNMEITVLQDTPLGFSLLDAATGRVIAQDKLTATDVQAVGAPAAFSSKTDAGVLLALSDGTLDLRNIKGERLRTSKLDLQFTTPPLIVQSTQSAMAMIGTNYGLIAVDLPSLKPLWRVATEGDAPRGQLSAADLDNDGTPEIVMITRRGRTVAVSTSNGKIKWYANIPNRAETPILIDLNADGLTDVLIASDLSSLTGHDGRNGALIFGDDKSAAISTAGNTTTAADERVVLQTCAYVGARGSSSGGGGGMTPLVVCNDAAGGGLRAETLPGK